MKKLFEKWFCEHKWKQHAKKVYEWEEKVYGTWGKMITVSNTKEVLICQHCGKIKKIQY